MRLPIRHTLAIAPGVSAEVVITREHQVQLVLPGTVTMSPSVAGMLAAGLERAAVIAAHGAAELEAKRTPELPRSTVQEVVDYHLAHAVEPESPAFGPDPGGKTTRRRGAKR